MRTPPPLLILAALLFWGWQSDLLIEGAAIGIILESARLVRVRWELDDTDFNRIFTFCTLLLLLLLVYLFAANEDGGGFAGLLHGNTGRNVLNSSTASIWRTQRWLPMIFTPFLIAQNFNIRESVPLTTVSMVLRWRRRMGDRAFTGIYLNVSYVYFMVCLYSAGIHSNTGTRSYFLGACPLIGWALWSLKTRRYHYTVWLVALVAAVGVGFLGQLGIGQVQTYLQNFNAQWMARFFHPRTDPTQSITSMGQVGELKLSANIVIWLQPQEIGKVPPYLREASYRTYHATKVTWVSPHTDFREIPAEPDGTSWVLIPDKNGAVNTNTSLINITCYLDGWSQELGAPEGLLPLPTGTRWLGNAPDGLIMKKNHNGAILAAGRGLLVFDARYALGATCDVPPDQSTNHFDLSVPSEETQALDQVTAELQLPPNASDEEKIVAVDRFFLRNFTYSTWQGKMPTNDITPLSRFLLTTRSGHCEYFASATTLLLRHLKIPARYAVGYYAHEPSGSGFVVRGRDAHAWCLAWDKDTKTWKDIDTTPPSWVSIETKRSSFMDWFSDLRSWLGLEFAKFRWSQAHLQQYILWSLTPVLLVLLYYIIFRRRGKMRAVRAEGDEQKNWPGLDSEFYQLEKLLRTHGVPRQAGEPLSRWMERLCAEPALSDHRDTLRQLLRLHYRHRFDPGGLPPGDREQLRQQARECLDSLKAAKHEPVHR